jgi:hypothetical protein
MSEIRDSLLTQLTTNLAGSNVSVASELPYTSGGDVLYAKNMKKLYVDEEQIEQETLYPVLDRQNVLINTSTVTAYLQVDAKNQLTDINSVISSILSAKSVVTATITSESDYATEFELDKILYTFEFRFEKHVN